MTIEDVLLKLRDIFSARKDLGPGVEVIVPTLDNARKVKGYAAMSGCATAITNADGCYRALVTGTPCGCGY